MKNKRIRNNIRKVSEELCFKVKDSGGKTMFDNRFYSNRFYKKTLKNISAAMAAVTLVSCGTGMFGVYKAYADTNISLYENQNQNQNQNENGQTGESGTTPGENGNTDPGTGEPVGNEAKNVNISVNYFPGENNTYTVNISSLDYLDGYKNFAFTVEVKAEGAEITNPKFGDKLKGGNYSVEGTQKVVFTKGSETVLQSGKLTLCSFTLTSTVAPTAENITISGLSAVDGEEAAVTFNPTVTVNEGPVVPELSEKENAVYDLMVALPEAESLSFYNQDKTLFDTAAFLKQVTDTETAYAELTDTEKANVNAVLDYNMKNKDIITTLKPIANAMVNVSEVISSAKIFSEIEESNLINYQFMINVYNAKVKDTISTEGIPDSSALKTEYDKAVIDITAAEIKITEKVTAADYSTRINAVSGQLDVILTLGDSKHYDDYLVDLLDKADKLYDEIEASDNSLKKYLCQDLEVRMNEIKAVQNGVAETPEVTYPENKRIARASRYKITVKRSKKSADVPATVTVKAYATQNNDEVLKDTWTFEIKIGDTSATGSQMAAKNLYPEGNIRLEVSYTVGGVTKVISEETVRAYNVNIDPGTIGIGSGSSSSGSGSGSGSGGNTKYPTSDELEDDKDDNKNDDKNNNEEEEQELFGDIGNYGWAKEAIEGLYYAGIVNGMEENVFNPAGEVTREQFCKMVVQMFGIFENETGDKFVDVKSDAWYAPYIYSAVRAGYIQGQSDEYFGVGESIMRQDMVTVLYRAIKNANNAAVLNFTDNDNIAEYAKDAVAQLVGMGVINGYEDGSFKPRGTATRAEAAKVIWGVYQTLNK